MGRRRRSCSRIRNQAIRHQRLLECRDIHLGAGRASATNRRDPEPPKDEDVRSDDDGDEEGGKETQRQMEEWLHGARIYKASAGGGKENKKDVDEAENIPSVVESMSAPRPCWDAGEEEDGKGRDEEIAKPGGNGKAGGQGIAATELDEIGADETGEVNSDQRADGDLVRPGSQPGNQEHGSDRGKGEQDGDELWRRRPQLCQCAARRSGAGNRKPDEQDQNDGGGGGSGIFRLHE